MPDRGNLADVPIAEKVSFLARPESYPERPTRVDLVETHLSHVFLLDRSVFKLKKPVRRPFLDFTTVEARLKNASEEVRLNRRLAPDVYLGIVALTRDEAGRLGLSNEGRVVDALVHMRRLPSERMLDRALARGAATREDAERVGVALAAFFRRARVATAPDEYPRRLASDVRADAAEHRRPELGLDRACVDAVERPLLDFIERRRGDLETRARDRRIVEGHGDLRPEHVNLGPPVLVIDCLEFNRDLRILDPLDELAFFGLECAALGASWFSDAVLDAYARAAHDPPPPGLVEFHGCCRALLRAKLALWHEREPGRRGPGHWREKAESYRRRAEALALALDSCGIREAKRASPDPSAEPRAGRPEPQASRGDKLNRALTGRSPP
jgi:aminoglycoside phosphotransferase family enzyme